MPSQGPPPGAHVTYSRQYRRCTKPGCPSCAGGLGHGPYWYAYWREGGRQRSHYLGKNPPSEEKASGPRGGRVAASATAPRATGAVHGSAPALRVRTLGGLAAWRGEVDLAVDAWRPRVAATLFACLLGAPGRRLRRDELAELLWPEGKAGVGQGKLRVAVHHLRRLLGQDGDGAGYLLQDGPFLRLAPLPDGQPDPDWPDAEAFEQAARAALGSRDLDVCRAALGLYGGDYLPEYATEEWATARREALAERYLALLLHQAALSERAGRTAEAAGCLRRALERDPCREEAARALMQLEVAAGRHEAAVRTYRDLARALRRDLGLTPDQETDAQYQAALAARLQAARARTNLPAAATSFVGRALELASLEGLLGGADEGGVARPRLVSLLGPGGVGKSRLALEAGRAALPAFPDGVWLVELAGLPAAGGADPLPVARRVGAALGLREEGGRDALGPLLAHLGPRRALLLLDNCEHLVGSCAALVGTLLGECSELRILTTSREALGLAGEHAWRLAPLPAPEEGRQAGLTLRQLFGHGAVRLFVERGRAARQGFALSEQNRAAVAQVCARLDGIPLALELAAARLGALTVAEVAARLEDRFRLLVGGNRGAPARHRTLRAVLDWSWELLGEGERALLRRLAVFAGGWTLEAAEAVCADGAPFTAEAPQAQRHGDDTESEKSRQGDPSDVGDAMPALPGTPAHEDTRPLSPSLPSDRSRRPERDVARASEDVLDLLAGLVARSLVQVAEQEGRSRYALLETVRRYALERLAETGEADEARERHLAHYMALAEGAEPHLKGSEQGTWLAALEREHDNLRAALRWAEAQDRPRGLHLAGKLWRFWEARGHLQEGATWLETLYTDRAPAATRAAARVGAGWLGYKRGDLVTALARAEEGVELWRQAAAPLPLAGALNNLAAIESDCDHEWRAAALYEECIPLYREGGDRWGMAGALNNLGTIALGNADYEAAAAYLSEALDLIRQAGDLRVLGIVLVNSAEVACGRGDPEGALALLGESLGLAEDLGDRELVAYILEGMARAHRRAEQWTETARLGGMAGALRQALGAPPPPADAAALADAMQAAEAVLGEARYRDLLASGRAAVDERERAGRLDYAGIVASEGERG